MRPVQAPRLPEHGSCRKIYVRMEPGTGSREPGGEVRHELRVLLLQGVARREQLVFEHLVRIWRGQDLA